MTPQEAFNITRPLGRPSAEEKYWTARDEQNLLEILGDEEEDLREQVRNEPR